MAHIWKWQWLNQRSYTALLQHVFCKTCLLSKFSGVLSKFGPWKNSGILWWFKPAIDCNFVLFESHSRVKKTSWIPGFQDLKMPRALLGNLEIPAFQDSKISRCPGLFILIYIRSYMYIDTYMVSPPQKSTFLSFLSLIGVPYTDTSGICEYIHRYNEYMWINRVYSVKLRLNVQNWC